MTPRQAFALANPINRASELANPASYQATRVHATGLLILTILAVDR